ncbi:unnamed protein product [Lactuca virosa]|uniref:Tim10-like domain-containing protein n=1 Tax=Lactuca virosa TaxID=75947 RepID=A0AAU9MFL5_9ASTR|nr:unnamed protein product [Lactuca virosa]
MLVSLPPPSFTFTSFSNSIDQSITTSVVSPSTIDASIVSASPSPAHRLSSVVRHPSRSPAHPSQVVVTFFNSAQPTMASNNEMPVALDKEQIFGMAEKEMEYRVELFNKLTHTCFAKCVEKRYKESELNMGENSCIDRCVSKYWQVTNLVGQLLGSGRPPM